MINLKKGDTVVAGNPVMDFTSVPLTVGKRYEVLEVVTGPSTLLVTTTDKGGTGIFYKSRFRKANDD